jgi:hemoglobin-like flavoprotein
VTVTPLSLERIRRSYQLMIPNVGPITARFYEELFGASPETRRLFTGDMTVQRRHFAAALALFVRNLASLDALEQPLRELGAGHARLGVRPHHYPAVRDAVIRAIAHALGESWTDEFAADWRMLLETVSRHMLAGALDAKPTAADRPEQG